jgi:hypothetical protein
MFRATPWRGAKWLLALFEELERVHVSGRDQLEKALADITK